MSHNAENAWRRQTLPHLVRVSTAKNNKFLNDRLPGRHFLPDGFRPLFLHHHPRRHRHDSGKKNTSNSCRYSTAFLGWRVFFSCRRVFFLRASFFSANNSIRVLLFFRSKENGGKPRWIFTPPPFLT
jgi:hypothetical protein